MFEFSVAPMLGWTDKYCRYFHRLLSRRAVLYTEMVTTGALLHADPARFLDFFEEEKPVVLQLGGSDPDELAACARLGEQWGYDQINLNVGCPSERVQNGQFGACLMAKPTLVAECVQAMRAAVSIPVTVKHRIGIDHQDSYEALCHFIETVAAAGCQHFIVHARKAWLQGLSPKQNRDIPPLKYHWVERLKQDFAQLKFSLNGGIQSIDQARHYQSRLDGVMMGRAIYHYPWLLAQVDPLIYGEPAPYQDRQSVIRALLPWVEAQCQQGVPLKRMTRHLLGLFHAQPGAKKWRRYLSEKAHLNHAGPEVLERALQFMS